MKTLQGLQLIITRPQAQAERWQHQLSALGARTFLLPVLDIVPVDDERDIQAVQAIAAQLHRFQKIIFVSQNAVRYAQQFFQLGKAQYLANNCEILAIGKTTAQAAKVFGRPVTAAGEAMNSETLLQLPALQAENVRRQSILICRGVGGRTTLGDALRERGAIVRYCELYYRRPNRDAYMHLDRLLKTDINTELTCGLTSHSGESLTMLAECIGHAGPKTAPLFSWPLLVPGQRVANIAKTLGFTDIICALNASDEIMTQTLEDWWRQRGTA